MDTAPPLRQLLAEAAVLGELVRGRAAWRGIARGHRGDGRGVLVIPGFMIGDVRTWTLRRTLAKAGYRPFGWGLGRNRGVSVTLFDRLEARLEEVAAEGPVALIGWSLGGIYAREIAKRRPELVERVITLGSPFSGDPRANNAWRIYERIAGHPVDNPPIAATLPQKPPVPTIALWSRKDGIVAPFAARGLPEESDRQIEVDCRHMGFTVAPAALEAILAALAAQVRETH